MAKRSRWAPPPAMSEAEWQAWALEHLAEEGSDEMVRRITSPMSVPCVRRRRRWVH